MATTQSGESSVLDRFAASRAAQGAAAVWGFAESAFFFLVPDVFLSLLALRDPRRACHAAVRALAGALIGGMLLYQFAWRTPDVARSLLEHVPGVHAALVDSVHEQIVVHGLVAVLWGPIQGIPYKIYAAEWGASRRSLAGFLLMSVPARLIRFLFSIFVTLVLVRWLAPWTRRRARNEVFVWAGFWVVFYGIYFSRMGW